jgi:hypothetical protein
LEERPKFGGVRTTFWQAALAFTEKCSASTNVKTICEALSNARCSFRWQRLYLTLIIELEEPPLLIRRMIICKSVLRG